MKKKYGAGIIILITSVFLLRNTSIAQIPDIKWQQCYGGSQVDRLMDILKVKSGYFLAGGTSSNDGDISFNHGSSDAWIIKIDSIGNILWEKTYGGSNGEFWRKILPAPNSCYYLLGASGSWDGDISYDPYPGSDDIWIAKIDSVGNLIWEKIIGGWMIDMVESGTATNDGGVVVFGWTGSQDGDVSVNYGMYDMWLVKLNSDGAIEWNKSYGTDDFDYGNTIIQTSAGGFLVGGTSTIGNNGNLTCTPHSSYAEAILLKLDSVGNIEWQNCYGGSDHDGIFSLVEVNEDYLVSAYADSDDGDVTGHHGESDIWVIMIDHSGNIIWENCFGGYRIELAYNIFKETNGDIIAIGPTSSNDGDVSGNHSLSTFDNDVWVIRINSYGDLLWQNCYGGIGNEGNVRFNALQIGTNNYIIGTITNYGPSYDVACTPYGGNQDEDYLVFEIGSLDTTGVEENEYAKDMVKVYPNPAKDYIIFETGRCPSATLKGGEPVRVIVMDVFGQELARIKVASEKTVFDLRQLRNGIYLFQVDVEGLIYSGKIMIQR